MSDNSLVAPLWRSLPTHARKQVQDGQQKTPQQIPVTVVSVQGELVTVKAETQGNYTIEQFQVAQDHSQWIRQPTQVGDKGVVSAGDYYLGGQTGLGGGTANYRDRANLTTMVYRAVSQKAFPKNPNRDVNAAFINGPNGVVLQDTNGTCVVTIAPNKITINVSGQPMFAIVGGTVFVGGDGSVGTYALIETTAGPSINSKARIG